MKKILILFILVVTLIVTGCAEQSEVPVDESENTFDESNASSENTPEGSMVAAAPIEEVITIGPVLEITSVTPDANLLHIYVRNTGDEPARDVYCGMIAYGVSNTKAYDEYVTLDDLHIMADAVKGGITGETYEYETDYKYKDTPNLTITYKMAGVDYMGDIQPGEVKKGSTEILYGTSNSAFLKIAWIKGQEENFSIY